MLKVLREVVAVGEEEVLAQVHQLPRHHPQRPAAPGVRDLFWLIFSKTCFLGVPPIYFIFQIIT